MTIPTLQTARLNLRPFAESDAEPLYHILSEECVLRYFPNPQPPARDRVARLVAHQIRHWEEHGFGWWAVELQAEPGLIGWNGLQYLPETGEIEIGYLLGRAHWGRGLATEGAQAGLRFGFTTLGLQTIIAVVHPENTASQGVIQKLGMAFSNKAEYFGMQVLRYTLDAASYRQHQEA